MSNMSTTIEENPFVLPKLNGTSQSLEQHIANLAQEEVVKPLGLLPISGFPLFIQDLITNCVEVYGIHRDFFSGAFLSAACIAIGDTCELDSFEYKNNVNIWISIISASGNGKSTPKKIFITPIMEMDAISYREYKKEMELFESIQSTAKRPIYVNRVTNGKTSPEALFEMLETNGRGNLLYRDEILSMVAEFEKERSGFLDGVLSFWSGEGTTIRTLSRGIQQIKRAFLPIFGGLQPHLLQSFGKDGRDNNGFIARFCCIFPDDSSRKYHTDKKISTELTLEYYEFIKQLFSIEFKAEDPHIFTLSEDAKNEYIKITKEGTFTKFDIYVLETYW